MDNTRTQIHIIVTFKITTKDYTNVTHRYIVNPKRSVYAKPSLSIP